jgi:hypothetical protein
MGHFEQEGKVFLISGVSEAVGTNGNGLAQEVWGMFVKSYNGSSRQKNVCAKIWEITKFS